VSGQAAAGQPPVAELWRSAVELVVARGRPGKWLIWLGAAVLVLAVAVGIAPFLLPYVFTPETLADWTAPLDASDAVP
jgi:hypothetical protein